MKKFTYELHRGHYLNKKREVEEVRTTKKTIYAETEDEAFEMIKAKYPIRMFVMGEGKNQRRYTPEVKEIVSKKEVASKIKELESETKKGYDTLDVAEDIIEKYLEENIKETYDTLDSVEDDLEKHILYKR